MEKPGFLRKIRFRQNRILVFVVNQKPINLEFTPYVIYFYKKDKSQ